MSDDPLSLTMEQYMESEWNRWVDDLLSGRIYERNLKLISDLPPGTMVYLPGHLPMTRERVLELCF